MGTIIVGGIIEKDGKFYWYKKQKRSVEVNGIYQQDI